MENFGGFVSYLGGVDGAVEQRRDGAAADADVRLHGEPLEAHLHLGRLHAQPALHHGSSSITHRPCMHQDTLLESYAYRLIDACMLL